MMMEVTICSVGDLMLSDSPLYVSVGVGSQFDRIKDKIFSECTSVFRFADIVIGNFESVIYKPQRNSVHEVQMASPQAVITSLVNAGFNVLNMANNHCLQHGTNNFLNGIQLFNSNGITALGKSNEDPRMMSIKGVEFAFLSICIHIEWYAPDNIIYETNIKQLIAQTRLIHKNKPNTIIVISVHWGDEFSQYPSRAQVELAHTLIEAGADIILGHHSHIFQGVEYYNGGLIAYSQGNFVSDMVPVMCRQTGILKINVNIKDGGEKEITSVMIPYYIDNDYCPRKDNAIWFNERQLMLNTVLENKIDKGHYWADVQKNRAICHKEFVSFFLNSFFKYKFCISATMMIEFMIRKIQKKRGKIGTIEHNMDAHIMQAIGEIN